MPTEKQNAVEVVIKPRSRDLGGVMVGRLLPHSKCRTVGPFVFLDEMGPSEFAPGKGIDVRPHPHIGLATVTYLFDGEIRHKDSLGSDQIIQPGDVNWMTAGRGIVHSERTEKSRRAAGQRLHGIQSWIALPEEHAEAAPAFQHYPKSSLPVVEREGVIMQLVAGTAFGETSPVKTYSPMYYLAVEAKKKAIIPLPDDHEERALFVAEGALIVDGIRYERGEMLLLSPALTPQILAVDKVRLILFGGAPMGKRKIWWNFVASDRERIEQAKADWLASVENNFSNTVFSLPPDETDFYPLPD